MLGRARRRGGGGHDGLTTVARAAWAGTYDTSDRPVTYSAAQVVPECESQCSAIT